MTNIRSQSSMLFEGAFGRATVSHWMLFLVQYYRLIIAGCISALLTVYMLRTARYDPLLPAIIAYLVYVGLRLCLTPAQEAHYYQVRTQIIRTQVSLMGVTLLLISLAPTGDLGALWILYIPGLYLASRHVPRLQWYLLLVIECLICLFFVTLLEAGASRIDLPVLLGFTERAIALILVSFFCYYLVRAHQTAIDGIDRREQIVGDLVQKMLSEHSGFALWWAYGQACRQAVHATHHALYLFDGPDGKLSLLQPGCEFVNDRVQDTYSLYEDSSSMFAQIAYQAIGQRQQIMQQDGQQLLIAEPIYGDANSRTDPLAVVVVQVHVRASVEVRLLQKFLHRLVQQTWPICAYAQIRLRYPIHDPNNDFRIQSLHHQEVYREILSTVVGTLGFDYAMISLVNPIKQTIEAVEGMGMPDGWIRESKHHLDSCDIQADVLRTGRVEVIDGWDDRFDHAIWSAYHHEQLVRVWVPLGQLGTIEAGFWKDRCPSIPRWQVELLARYARAARVSIENANLGAAERAKIDAIARLTEQSIGVGHTPIRNQGYPATSAESRHGRADTEALPQLIPTEPHNERALLSHMLQIARQLLQSSSVTLFLHTQEGNIQNPISAHDAEEAVRLRQIHDQLRQRLPHLRPMMASGQALYIHQQSDGDYRDLLFDGSCLVAILPLLVHGQLLGVLHIAYRHQTSELREQQVIELFARQIAIVIFTGRLIRSDERRQLERNLHDTAKTGVRTMMLYIKLAHDALQRNCTEAKQHLHEARRQGWVVLSDISLVLNDLSEIDTDTLTLKELIQKHLPVLGGQTSEKIDLRIAEHLPALPLTVTRALLFIIREAVVNAREHGGATQVQVTVSAERETHRLKLLIVDNGSGFDPQQIRQRRSGLTYMQERAEEINGTVDIESVEGYGAKLTVFLPYREAAAGCAADPSCDLCSDRVCFFEGS